MAIELSDLKFTELADIVPASGEEEIVNTSIANTLAGNDVITGTHSYSGISNNGYGIIDTGEGNDKITGTGRSFGIQNYSIFNTGEGNDKIIGNANFSGIGILNADTMDTGAGDDEITGIGSWGINNRGTINSEPLLAIIESLPSPNNTPPLFLKVALEITES